MGESEQIMTRYLLGELSETEQAALEERYFTDPQVFDHVLQTETGLVDNYARGRLSSQAREQFERSYLTHPRRRERVKFAAALATKLDQNKAPGSAAEHLAGTPSWWQRLSIFLRGHRLILEVSIVLTSVVVAIVGLWFFIESRQARQQLAQPPSAQASQGQRDLELQQQRARELEQQIASEQKRADELAAELERVRRTQQQTPQAEPTPPVRPVQTFASVLLTVGSVRSGDVGQTPTLTIPAGTAQARLQLNLKENDYQSYRVSVQQIGGGEIVSQQSLKPIITKSGARFTLVVPTSKFAKGDYILTLSGVTQDGKIDDLGKSIFHVEKDETR